jgi:hypothetical protein
MDFWKDSHENYKNFRFNSVRYRNAASLYGPDELRPRKLVSLSDRQTEDRMQEENKPIVFNDVLDGAWETDADTILCRNNLVISK